MTDWEPATEAEAAMRDALRANDQEMYFRILARAELLLPVPADAPAGHAPNGWGTWTTGGRTHVLAFTSETALRACLAHSAGAGRRVPYFELAGNWPNIEWWLAVNPGLPIEGYLPAWFVAQLARGDVRLPGRTLAARARLEQAESAARGRTTASASGPWVPHSGQGSGVVPSGRILGGAGGGLSGRSPGPTTKAAPMGAPAGPSRDETARRVPPAADQGATRAGDRPVGPAAVQPGPGGLTRRPVPGRSTSQPDGGSLPGHDPGPAGAAAQASPGPAFTPRRPAPSDAFARRAFRPARQLPPRGADEVGFFTTRTGDTGPAGSQASAAPATTEPASAPAPHSSAASDPRSGPVDHGSPGPPPGRGLSVPVIPPAGSRAAASGVFPGPAGSAGQPGVGGEPTVGGPKTLGSPSASTGQPPAPPAAVPAGDGLPEGDAARSATAPGAAGPGPGVARAAEPGPGVARTAEQHPAFVPANEVEESLFAAAGGGSTDAFLSTLLLARVLLPVAPESAAGSRPGDDGFLWRTETIDDETYLVVFTSPHRLADHFAAPVDTVSVKFVQMIRHWPDATWSFAVNPGTPVGAKLPGTQIVALASWAADVGLRDDAGESTETPVAPEPAPRSAYEPVREQAGVPTMMQKTVAPSQVAFYLERGYDRVSGFVHRAGEVAHLTTPAKLYTALGLGYAGSPFAREADEVYVIRWPAHRPSLYRIPYGGQHEAAMRAMEGWVIERAPFRGNGFAPGDSSDVVAEFKVDSVRLPHGAQLWRIAADGTEKKIAVLNSDGPAWQRAGEG